MKPAPLGTVHSGLPPAEAELAAAIERIFGRLPALHGFAVQDGARLVQQFPGVALEGALVVSDVGVYPPLGEKEHDRICNEIASALHEYVALRPDGADLLLRGRTFARALQ
ncbi:MAG TPA: hypothetical protein VFB08_05235 [Burkholderiales bacterium]|nr:hypothetical protein [Burkholderiales bacterium]